MSTLPTVVDLRAAHADALARERELRDRRTRIGMERRAAFERTLDAELNALFENAIREAALKTFDLQRELDAAIESAALAAPHNPPLGTVMEEWKATTGYSSSGTPDHRTGRLGVLEVITRTSEHLENQRWGLATVGEVVIRILKKDRTPGKGYVRGWKMIDWKPAKQGEGS